MGYSTMKNKREYLKIPLVRLATSKTKKGLAIRIALTAITVILILGGLKL